MHHEDVLLVMVDIIATPSTKHICTGIFTHTYLPVTFTIQPVSAEFVAIHTAIGIKRSPDAPVAYPKT
jgi:hypothetical protein